MTFLEMPHGYLSSTKYTFRNEDAKSIIRNTTYSHDIFSRSVIWYPSTEHSDIRSSISNTFQRTSNLSLLGVFPLEIWQMILLGIDMQSLFRFRQTNLHAREMVSSLLQYQPVVHHGLDLYCALLQTELADTVTLFDFYRALCTRGCEFCGEFGGFIFLLTFSRCCYQCLQTAPQTKLQSQTSAEIQFRLNTAESDQVRSFTTLPGRYTMWGLAYTRHTKVVSTHQARLFAHSDHKNATEQTGDEIFRCMGSCALPYYDKQTKRAERGMLCAGCLLAVRKFIMDVSPNVLRAIFKSHKKLYERDGYLEHFQWCEQAQRLWEQKDWPPHLFEGQEYNCHW